MTRIEKLLKKAAWYLEQKCFCQPRCTTPDIVKAVEEAGLKATAHYDDPHGLGAACLDGGYVTFRFEKWTVYIVEEMFALDDEGNRTACPPI